MKKHHISALVLSFCLLNAGFSTESLSALADSSEKLSYGVLSYQIENGGITITACDKNAESVEIPAEIEGVPVVKIGTTSFYGCSLSSVTIPENVTTIASGAFWSCENLTEVSFPESLTTIENYAFNECKSLASVSFTENLTSIGNEAFVDTAWLDAQKEISHFVIVNHILIDASAVVLETLDVVNAEKEKRAAAIEEAKKPWVRAEILTNQVGYFPELSKKATLLSDSTKGIKFSLLNKSGNAVYSGTSVPMGLDEESGDNVHVLDFSEFKKAGTYTLKAENGAVSREFQIGIQDTYSGLVYDALNYFYQNRSGIAIEEQYITSGEPSELAREAGHAPDIAEIQNIWGYESSSGTQDVSGGWYDAGDHGKYVVNGGVALWMMQNQYERAFLNGKADIYQDGTMQIPENNNKIADILDESRYEMEWMLKMIVQDGDCKGMAYHKVHDAKWTGIGLAPADDNLSRILIPPTTAATLNLSACGAQAYRLWKEIDPEFAETCLTASKNAYEAAKKHPEMYASSKEFGGGGAYSDDDATDEFYWAACELYISTGEKQYYSDLKKASGAFSVPSSIYGGNITGSFDWGNTAALGSLSLLVHPELLTEKENQTLTTNLTKTADSYLNMEAKQGYGLPYQANDGNYPWGSNSFVADNAVVLAYAYDKTQNIDYLNGVVGATDYLLGRNPLDYSYVTGYGSHSSQYPHHRWWAKAEKKTFPKAPCGVLVGGCNNGKDDPIVTKAWKDIEISPLKAYVDDIQAYSVNECAINWNAPLAWVVSYLCEQNGGVIAGHSSGGQQIPELPSPEDVEIPKITVTIPDDVTVIGEQIFGKYKSYVNEVIIPDGVTSIGKQAFSQCSKLEEITLPTTLKSVGEKAFSETPWLKNAQKDSPLLIINGFLIDGSAAKGDIVIPEDVVSILGNAFYMNTNITSVAFPEGLETIGKESFSGCSSLKEITFPESLKTIQEKAFADTAITELTIPKNVETIGEEAFVNCKELPAVTICGENLSIGTEAFGCTDTFTATGQYSYVFIHQVIEDFSVICNKNSSAEDYASATGVKTALFGDVTNDGEIDILDVITINKAVLGKETIDTISQKTADVNRNGIPDSSDSLNILKYIVGLLTSF